MTYIFWAIRSAFCKHDFEYDETHSSNTDAHGRKIREGMRVSATCSKCGWHRKYWKFN